MAANAPKQPLTAFFRFCASEREKSEEKIAPKVLSERWRGLSIEEKKPFTEIADRERKEYNEKFAAFKQTDAYQEYLEAKKKKKAAADAKKRKRSGKNAKGKPMKKKKTLKDPNGPKRPLTPYFMFAKEVRESVKAELGDNKNVTQVAKEIGKKWKEISEEEKQKYKDAFKKEKEKYDVILEEYKQSDNYKKHQQKVAEANAQWEAQQRVSSSSSEEESDSGSETDSS